MIAAIDIGGTNTRVAIFDKHSNKIDYLKMDTNKDDPKSTLDKVIDFINLNNEVKSIGISAPGPADYEKGIFLISPNLPGWTGFHFIEYIKTKTKINIIKSQNDANLMALANHFNFKKTKKDITHLFTISTGFGAGLIINNKIFTGFNGYAQEIAHVPLAFSKEQGKNLGAGSLEYFSSGSGMALRSGKTTKALFDEYQINDKSKKIIDDGIEALANAIATSAAFLNPSMIVFDGSVARNNKWYVEKAIALSKDRMIKSQFDVIDFEFSSLGDDSALLGAYYLMTTYES